MCMTSDNFDFVFTVFCKEKLEKLYFFGISFTFYVDVNIGVACGIF